MLVFLRPAGAMWTLLGCGMAFVALVLPYGLPVSAFGFGVLCGVAAGTFWALFSMFAWSGGLGLADERGLRGEGLPSSVPEAEAKTFR